jgi:hypothetical protein
MARIKRQITASAGVCAEVVALVRKGGGVKWCRKWYDGSSKTKNRIVI